MAVTLLATSHAHAEGANIRTGEFDNVIINPCNGEKVALHNEFRVVVTSNEDGSGGTHTTIHLTNQASGEGLTTGAKYHDVVQSNSISNTPDPNNFERTVTANHLLISQGDAPNFRIRLIFHVTMANGELTATFVRIETDCDG